LIARNAGAASRRVQHAGGLRSPTLSAFPETGLCEKIVLAKPGADGKIVTHL
jgi:hypothetical protein